MTAITAAFLVTLSSTFAAADLSGRWTLTLDPDFSGNPETLYCTIKQSNASLTLDCGDTPISGQVKDQDVTFRFKTGDGGRASATLSGVLNEAATAITGKWHLEPDNREGKFELKRR
jgi:hypothetical protein